MIKINIEKKHWALVLATLIYSCSTTSTAVKPADLTDLKFTVEQAPEWSALFTRSSGWFGGDGIFAMPSNGVDHNSDQTPITILFSDTMIGEIEKNELKPGFVMTHNSVATLAGSTKPKESIAFHWDTKSDGSPEAIFIPKTPDTKVGDYYWLGDGFVNNELEDRTYVFGYRIKDIKGVATFGFEHVGTTLIIIPKGSKPPYKDQRQIDAPLFIPAANGKDPLAFGSGIFVNTKKAGAKNPDGYVYVYGIKGADKSLVVSRVHPRKFENFEEWRFWDGEKWSMEMKNAKEITNRLSNELSVSELPDGRYALVFQVDGIGSVIGMRIGSTPIGPFGPIIPLYDSKPDLVAKNIFSYNAKAHPALSEPGELLISYNVNSFDFEKDIRLYPNLYRPRFIKVKF